LRKERKGILENKNDEYELTKLRKQCSINRLFFCHLTVVASDRCYCYWWLVSKKES